MFVILMASALPANAALDCPQGHAVYQDRSGKFELLFQPKTMDKNYNTIELVGLASGARFDGSVQWNMGFAVPNVQIDYPCGSGTDARQCHYQSVVYTLTVNNGQPVAAAMLPPDNDPAADTILLPDLSRHWHYNVRALAKEAIPDEVFRLTRCRQP
ncbi:MAG: hypothetical protein OER56_02050 [Hyphomicrobiales bacterium]|nr:hypothetical protein [Hyphomicrobiales bacterium]